MSGTKRIWALVEVEDPRHGDPHRLVGGFDPDAAIAALHDLYRLRLDGGPACLFGPDSDATQPRLLGVVIKEDYHRDPAEWIESTIEHMRQTFQQRATDERVAEWRRDHPKEEARIVKTFGVDPGRPAYLRLLEERQRLVFDRLMQDAPLTTKRGWLAQVAEWLDVPVEKLAAATQGDEDQPFFSEAYLYNLIGKGPARTVLAYVNDIATALGVNPRELQATPSPEEQRLAGNLTS